MNSPRHVDDNSGWQSPQRKSRELSIYRVRIHGQRIIRLSMGRKNAKNDLMPGTLDMLVLKTLTHGLLHGYAIAQLIQQISDDVLQVEEGSLYPALQRLELNGWIEGEWGMSVNNRRARFYRLTSDGRKQLAAETARYKQTTGAIGRVMGLA